MKINLLFTLFSFASYGSVLGISNHPLNDDVSALRLLIRPHWQHQKYEAESANLNGAAPTIRKGFSVKDQEFSISCNTRGNEK